MVKFLKTILIQKYLVIYKLVKIFLKHDAKISSSTLRRRRRRRRRRRGGGGGGEGGGKNYID